MRLSLVTVLAFCLTSMLPGATLGAPLLVVVDAGHGGRDPGAIGVSGIEEKAITLAAARRLVAEFDRLDGLEVIATRLDDRFLSLAERLERIETLDADLLISLHADSLPVRPQLRGASVYTLATIASTAEAARKAHRENAATGDVAIEHSAGESAVRPIVTSLMRRFTTERSVLVAEAIAAELATVTRVLPQPLLAANFFVLRSLDTPSVLVELGYLSNAEDERLLADAEHLNRLVRAIARGVQRALFASPPQPASATSGPVDAGRALVDRAVPLLSPGPWTGRVVVPR